MCFFTKKYKTEEEHQEIRKLNEKFDFGLSGKSNDDPTKWLDEMSMLDIIDEEDEKIL